MIRNKLFHIILYFIILIPSFSFAEDFDGSKLVVGSVEKVLEINQFKIDEDVDPDTVGLPRKFFIDIEQKRVLPSKESMVRRISRINHVEHVENKVFLQALLLALHAQIASTYIPELKVRAEREQLDLRRYLPRALLCPA